jgi:molybdenum cofactor cytidylyltransferase
MLDLAQALRLEGAPAVALVGAGGKTTAAFELARAIRPSVVTATTDLGEWQSSFADRHWALGPGEALPDAATLAEAGVALVTGPLDQATHRYAGFDLDACDRLRAAVRGRLPLFVEADGSRQRPLQAPAPHEPAIPDRIDVVVVVAGLSGLGQPLTEVHVHRSGAFAALAGCAPGDSVTPARLARVLMHPEGGLKGVPRGARRVALLTQADTPRLAREATRLAQSLGPAFEAIVVTRRRGEAREAGDATTVLGVHERVAGIVLAAGGSTRFGAPKQLLDYHGVPFVRAVADAALAAGLAPIVVVTGAHGEQVRESVDRPPIEIVYNAEWADGQATSVRAGVAALPPGTGAAVFLLADQPQVTSSVVAALASRHARGLFPIVAPVVAGTRANPVLFDRVTFRDLASLSGDIGGRGIASRYQVELLEWPDRSLLLDVDTPDDYRRLMHQG